jgi:hypothetical protein
MLARYEDLMASYSDVLENALQGKQDYRMVKYWETLGHDEQRDYGCDNLGSSLIPCAKVGGDCQCPNGDVYFVRTKDKFGGKLTPQESLQYRHISYSTNDKSVVDPTASVKCEAATFKGSA